MTRKPKMRTLLKFHLTWVAILGVSLSSSVQADVMQPFSSTGYRSADKDWVTNIVDDIDGNGLGTDGFIFFGDFLANSPGNSNPGNDGNSNIIGANANTSLFTASAPSYVTNAETILANSGNVGQFAGYELIDNPLTLDGTDEFAGNLLVTGNGNAVEFTVSGLAANTTIRVGVLGTVINDVANGGRFDSPEIFLTDGTNTETVTGLANVSGSENSLGWVFFDIDADGTYGVGAPIDAAGVNPDVTGLGGLTFDSFTSSVPEPSSLALFGLCAFGFGIRRRRS